MGKTHKSSVIPLKKGDEELPLTLEKLHQDVNEELTNLSNRIESLEQQITSLNNTTGTDNFAKKLREELIDGIRLLGTRVTKAIQDMNDRFDEFKNQYNAPESIKPSIEEEVTVENTEEAEETKDDEYAFGTIKESSLLDEENFELVSKTNVARLAQLFRKQSESIKKIVDIQHKKFTDYEFMLTTFHEESTRSVNSLENKVKRNFFFYMGGFVLLIIIIVLLRFVV